MNNITESGFEKMMIAAAQGRLTMKKNAEAKRIDFIEFYKLHPNKCKFCDKDIELPLDVYSVRKKQFCNNSCAAKYNNVRKKIKTKVKTGKICLFCEKEYYGSGKKYCSLNCQTRYRQKEVWKQIEDGTYKTGTTNRAFKTYLKYHREYKCCKCANTGVWQGKSLTLELEHLDGNSENNALDNLEWICPNCHSQTDTYKSKNKGNGRFSRRQRYKEGKSY